MLYTIVPLEIIFADEEPSIESIADHQEVELNQEGIRLMVQQSVSGQYKISRLISTNPQDYLRAEWQPGSIIY